MAYLYDDEDNAPMNDDAFEKLGTAKNCHERCPHSKICYEEFKCKGFHDPNYPFECPNFDKIENIMQEAAEIPFYDPDFDLPEEEEGEC